MQALLIVVMLNGVVQTRQLPTQTICNQTKVEVSDLANVQGAQCYLILKEKPGFAQDIQIIENFMRVSTENMAGPGEYHQ